MRFVDKTLLSSAGSMPVTAGSRDNQSANISPANDPHLTSQRTFWSRGLAGRRRLAVGIVWLCLSAAAWGQIDPFHRNLLQLGYDQPLAGRGPHGFYIYYYYNNPEILYTNIVLRMAIAPAYLDGEFGFRQLLSRYTDVGIGLYGGAYGDNYYEIRQGDYRRKESFDGYGGGTSLSLYQLLNPGMLIPLNADARVGFRHSAFAKTRETADEFILPNNRPMPFVRAGVRLAGKEPILYPDLGLEVSAWVERYWRFGDGAYGFNRDRAMNPRSDLYWVYAGAAYAWTNVGHKASLAVTVGGSEDTDRFSAWRVGGVLPLIAEFPLILPGYYYQELTAERFVHLHGSYVFPLFWQNRFQFRLEMASALLDYLGGFEQPDRWQTGAGCGITYTPKMKNLRVVLRYGYGFNALREKDGQDEKGAHSVGLLFQYDFERHHDRR
jgi:hypothetical protein